jgi:hypothetical protein
MNIFLKILNYSVSFSSQFGNGFQPPTDVYTQGADDSGEVVNILTNFLSNLIGLLTIFGALFFIVNFFLGALAWISAGDDSGKVEKARTKIMHGVLGLIIIVLAYSIIGLIGQIIGIDLINLGETIEQVVPTL